MNNSLARLGVADKSATLAVGRYWHSADKPTVAEFVCFRTIDSPAPLVGYRAIADKDGSLPATACPSRPIINISNIENEQRLYDQWCLVINPTYFFTTNGFIPHSYPAALLAGRKRLDNSASLRGQLIMWHRFLNRGNNLFSEASSGPLLKFGEPPTVTLATRVPEDVWGSQKKSAPEPDDAQERMFG